MNIPKYKIVLCTPALYSVGGVERVVAVKANYFADQLGYDVTIIVSEGNGLNSYFAVSKQVQIVNFDLGFEELWKLPFINKIAAYLKKQKQYKRLLSKELMSIRPDITISTLRREINFLNEINDGSLKIGELHVNRANYRNFSEKDSNLIKRIFAFFWIKDLVRHLKRLDKMVVLTDSALDDWPELSNVVKIPDPLSFRIDTKSTLQNKRIVSIGRYDYDKGNDLLLQIWSKVEMKMKDWCLDVYGNGNRDPYQDLALKLGIDQSRCRLHGPVSDVKTEYLNGSIFVLPSRYEGFGLVLIEAMACGVPVVSFNCENGPRSIITEGEDGFLIPTFDIDAFADKLILLMQDSNLRRLMGEKAQKSAAKYDIDSIGSQWKQLFDELMANR